MSILSSEFQQIGIHIITDTLHEMTDGRKTDDRWKEPQKRYFIFYTMHCAGMGKIIVS